MSKGNSFLVFLAPVLDHEFTVVKFLEDDWDEDNVEIIRQFRKHDGEYMIVEYGGYRCEFCEVHSCDHA